MLSIPLWPSCSDNCGSGPWYHRRGGNPMLDAVTLPRGGPIYTNK